ncbi:MAG TPA: alpha/beta hydrolase [Micropepsaceae bacterium]|nr:alpha/beta hydrolase [Micropepsaceae bacterium]
MASDRFPNDKVGRRRLIGAGFLIAGAGMTMRAQAAAPAIRDPMIPLPIPPQVPAKEGLALLSATRLWYWDTGGTGQPVVFLHPATGSSQIWGYQQPVFAAAGYRVIGYSRRGYYKSDPVPKANPATASGDLRELLDVLQVGKCHIAGSAAGCAIAIDFALSHPERLFSLTLACGVGGIQDTDYVRMADSIRPPGYDGLPAAFRELSPSYRAANPQGTAQWAALEKSAVTGNRFGQTSANRITWSAIQTMSAPVLLIGGDSDLGVPPPMLRTFASHLKNAELVLVPEAGHSVYWEQPELFNRTVLGFVARHTT